MLSLEISQPEGPAKHLPLTGRHELGPEQGCPQGALLLELRNGLVVATAGGAPFGVRGRTLAHGERRILLPGQALEIAGRKASLRSEAGPVGTQVLARDVLKASAERPVGALGPELCWLNGPELGKRVRLTGEATFLGRAEGCAARLSDPQSSRMHAKLVRTPQGIQLVDLMSANGIFVDDERVQGGRPLRGGEILRIGETLLGFVCPEAAPAPAPEAPKAPPAQPEAKPQLQTQPQPQPAPAARPPVRRVARAEVALLSVAGLALLGGSAAVWWALQ